MKSQRKVSHAVIKAACITLHTRADAGRKPAIGPAEAATIKRMAAIARGEDHKT